MAATLGGTFNPAADITLTGTVVLSGPTTLSGTPTLTGPTLTASVVTPKVTVYADSGAIAVESHVAVLTKASASAMTLAAPTVNGTTITIIAGTSVAHVVTGTNLFWAGETGGPFNKVTTAAFIGSSATLVAYNSLWMVVSDQIATVGD
jgi:hypothetical protein